MFSSRVNSWLISYLFQVVITNLEAGSLMDLDAKKWPDAQLEDPSSFYKVTSCYLKSYNLNEELIGSLSRA